VYDDAKVYVPARAHFLICYAPEKEAKKWLDSSGQSAFPDLLRSADSNVNAPIEFRPERIS